MKKERKFDWCVRFYSVKTGSVDYRIFYGWTAREINLYVSAFTECFGNYLICIFKKFKTF